MIGEVCFQVDTVKSDSEQRSVILVIEDVEETRDGIEQLLTTSGHRVRTARNEDEAVGETRLHRPDLILISLGLNVLEVLSIVARIREHAGIGEDIPFVIFCSPDLDEGAELTAGHNVYLTRPDNFDQLRAFLSRLLPKKARPC